MRFLLVVWMAAALALGSAPTQWLWAQGVDNATPDETKTIQHLAQAGYLDPKGLDMTATTLTEDQVTDALLAIQERLKGVDLKNLPSGAYQAADLQSLEQLVESYSDLLRDRKVSAWLYENRVKKMIQALTPAPATPVATPQATPTAAPAAPVPTATAVPPAGPTLGDLNALQDKLKDMSQKLTDLQARYDQKLQDEDNTGQVLKSKDQERQDEMKLVKNLMDTYESNLQKVNDRLDQVAQKASEKTLSDEELQQELTIMHKDLRDNTQDLTVLKQQVALLDAPQKVQQDPLDDFLTSKWLAGGALLVGLAALTVAVTKK